MGKKKHSSGNVSTGSRRSSIGAKNRGPGQRLLNQMTALDKGKDVVFTVANPNKSETDKPFIRKKVSGREWMKRRDNFKPAGGKTSD